VRRLAALADEKFDATAASYKEDLALEQEVFWGHCIREI
jgi:hypothetical protein